MPPPPSSRTPVEQTDVDLLAAWVRHQREADFTELVRRHLNLVQGIARRQLGPDQADDISQRVFAILARKATSLIGLRSLSAWLHQVTVFQCRSAVRGQIRERRSQEAAMETARIADGRDPLAEALPHLDSAIGSLPDSDRELILLRYSEGLSFREAAMRTGRREAALRQQAGRALEKLSGILHRRGVSVPVVALTTGLGVHLSGSSTASAAVLVASSALVGAGGITCFSLTGLTFLTMTVKQSIVAGALLAALVISGPLAWQSHQIRQTERALTAAPISVSPGDSLSPVAETVKPRVAGTMSDTDRQRMLSAVPGIFQAAVKSTMTEWFERDAWIQARRTATALGLTEQTEIELRNFLIAEHASVVDSLGQDDDKEVDYADRHRQQDERLTAWFADHLTADQQQQRLRMDETALQATAARMAETAVGNLGTGLDLTGEQRSSLLKAAIEKANHSLEEKAYSSSLSVGFNFLPSREVIPIEERSQDLVQNVLSPEQKEIWSTLLQRDHGFGDNTEQRVIGEVIQQIQRAKLTPDEIRDAIEDP